LKAIADRIRSCLKPSDLIARLGGDEFAVIQTKVETTADVLAFVTRIHEAIRRPYRCLGHQLSTDASIGIALAPQDGANLDQLIKNADLAMYGAKAEGRRTYRFFVPAMDARAKARLTMEQDLRQAMVDSGFEIHYQPLVNLHTNDVAGCEALLRWRHPSRGMVSPAEFIPVAEDTGLINDIGDWVLRTACAEAATWPAHVRLAVNVSPVQLKCATLALKIAGALAASGLEPRRLELEITEAVLIRDDEAALSILHQLRSIGVRIALDDFGTGYSSLSYLKRFPFDKIKIDRCFVADIAEASGSPVIVQAIVNIASASNMTTVAEGVETGAQREMLRALGCTEMQGYLFSAPKAARDVRERSAEAALKWRRWPDMARRASRKSDVAHSYAVRLMQHLVVPTFVIDPERRVVIWNRACERLTGVSASEVIGTTKHWQAFYEQKRYCLADLVALDLPEQLPDLYSKYAARGHNGFGFSAENWCVMPKLGNQLYLAIDAGPIHMTPAISLRWSRPCATSPIRSAPRWR
jgi:predicted signal transduction protein with EAL and GGDEF domain